VRLAGEVDLDNESVQRYAAAGMRIIGRATEDAWFKKHGVLA
jgi:hypothetical protein